MKDKQRNSLGNNREICWKMENVFAGGWKEPLPFPLCILYCWCLSSSVTFKVTFCLLLSGVLKGDKSHTKKTTPQQKITNPPFKHKQTNPTTHKQQKPPNNFKTLCSPSLQLLYCLFSFKEEKNPQNIICVCLQIRRDLLLSKQNMEQMFKYNFAR